MRPLAALLAVIFVSSSADAQLPSTAEPPAASDRAVWGGAGVGLGSVGALVQLDASLYRASRLLRGRLTAHSNLGGFGTRADESVTELSALLGRGAACCGGNWGSASVGGGVVVGRRGPDEAQFTTVGLAGEAALMSRRRPRLSVSAFANLNPERSFAGLSLSLVFGRTPFANL